MERRRPAGPTRSTDALALRLAALDAAEIVFRVTHQLHGAIGFCDETTLSWVSRAASRCADCPSGCRPPGPPSPSASGAGASPACSDDRPWHGCAVAEDDGRRVLTPIAEALDHVLADDPARVAVVGPSRAITYGDLDAEADAAAAALRELGVRPGDRVAASLPNDVDIVVAFHGTMRLGAVWVGVNANLAPPEQDAILAVAAPAIVLADPAVAASLGPGWRVVEVDPDDGTGGWRDAVRASTGASRLPSPPIDAAGRHRVHERDDRRPKGIVHSQRNLVLPARALVASRGYDEALRKGDSLPLTILNLQVLTTLLTTAAGGCCVLTDRRDPRGIAEWIAPERSPCGTGYRQRCTAWSTTRSSTRGSWHRSSRCGRVELPVPRTCSRRSTPGSGSGPARPTG